MIDFTRPLDDPRAETAAQDYAAALDASIEFARRQVYFAMHTPELHAWSTRRGRIAFRIRAFARGFRRGIGRQLGPEVFAGMIVVGAVLGVVAVALYFVLRFTR